MEKSIERIREIYSIPEFPDSELIIDIFASSQGALEYAEIECPSKEELKKILETFFHFNPDEISDAGITSLTIQRNEQSISRKIEKLKKHVI